MRLVAGTKGLRTPGCAARSNRRCIRKSVRHRRRFQLQFCGNQGCAIAAHELGGKRDRRIGCGRRGQGARRCGTAGGTTRRAGRSDAALHRGCGRSGAAGADTTSPELTANTAAAVKRRVARRSRLKWNCIGQRGAAPRRTGVAPREHGLLALRRKLAAMWGDSEAHFESVQRICTACRSPTTSNCSSPPPANPDFSDSRRSACARCRDPARTSRRAPDVISLVGACEYRKERTKHWCSA